MPSRKPLENDVKLLLLVRLRLPNLHFQKPKQTSNTSASLSGDEATFTCTAVSGFRTGSTLLLVEVTDRDNIVRHQSSSFTASNLQIPQGVDRLTRRFVCELWAQQTFLSTSEEAELIIVARGTTKTLTISDFTV